MKNRALQQRLDKKLMIIFSGNNSNTDYEAIETVVIPISFDNESIENEFGILFKLFYVLIPLFPIQIIAILSEYAMGIVKDCQRCENGEIYYETIEKSKQRTKHLCDSCEYAATHCKKCHKPKNKFYNNIRYCGRCNNY